MNLKGIVAREAAIGLMSGIQSAIAELEAAIPAEDLRIFNEARIEPKYLDVKESANYLRIARSTMYKWLHEGRIPSAPLSGNHTVVRIEDLDRFVESKLILKEGGNHERRNAG